MTILVIGRSGQLARSLAERGGDTVTLLGRPELDLAIPGSASAAIRSAVPRVIINAAAFTAVDLAEADEVHARRINAGAAGEIATAARDLGVPLIQVSTDYVFDGTAVDPIGETVPTAPINAYGRTKLAGEAAVRAATDDHLIIRTSWLFSPFGRNFVRTMVELGQQRQSLSVVRDQHGSPTSALDLADGLLVAAGQLADRDGTGIGASYHLSGSGVASWADVAAAVQARLALRGRKSAVIAPIPTSEWPTAARRPDYSALDSSKFAGDFGFTMPDWRSSVGLVVDRLIA